MKKWRGMLAVLMLAAFCTGVAAAEKVFVYNLEVEPRTIDPALNNAVDGSQVIQNIFEGLLRIGFDDKPEPGLAESWETSEDGMTWTFHLRDGLKWSDGTPLTAEHFRYGILRALNPETAAPYAHYAFCIKNGEKYFKSEAKAEDVGVSAPDDRTLRLDLEYMNPLMIPHISQAVFDPVKPEAVEANPRSWAASADTIVSNGPFYLADWKHNSEIVLAKNPYYWDAENVKIDKVRMVMIGDANTALAAFKGKRLDFMKNIPPMLKASMIAKGEAKVSPSLGVSFSVFNTKASPFDDVRVRKAFSLAIDRDLITKKVTMAGEAPATGYISETIAGPDGFPSFRAAAKVFCQPNARVEEAKALLAEAGYPDGKGFPEVTYKYNTSDTNRTLAEALQAMWKKNLGVNVKLYNEEWKVFLNTRRQLDFQIARHGYVSSFPDASLLLELWLSTGIDNCVAYDNPEYDALILAARTEMDNNTRIGYLIKAEELLLNDAAVLPIHFYSTPYLINPRVKGLYVLPRKLELFRGIELDG